jgi:VCBS repeat-containing protein
MNRTATASVGRGGRGRRIGSAALAVLVLLTSVLSATAAEAAECGCKETGEYVAPARKAAQKTDLSPGPGTYRLIVPNDGPYVPTLQLAQAATGETIEDFWLPLPRLDFGFSPDGKRFMYRHAFMTAEGASPQLDVIGVFDIAGDRHVFNTNANAGAGFSWSPHGRWFVINELYATNWAGITVRNSVTAESAYSQEIIFTTPPGVPGQQFGAYGMGFSSEAADRTFVRAYRDNNGQNQLQAVNLETGTTIAATVTSEDAFWKFSKCGDVFGLVNQQDQVTQAVTLYKTAAPGPVGASLFPRVEFDVVMESTPESHRVLVYDDPSGPSITDVGANTADNDCTPAVALADMTASPTEVIGGEDDSTGTISLNTPATAPFPVSLSSSDTTAAMVPSSVSVSAGNQTRSFTITTKVVSAPKSVTITATANGVSRAVTVTVKPSPASVIDSVTVDPARPIGGQADATGTVNLAGPAGPSGTVVNLSSSVPAAASVPAVLIIPAAATSATFAITTATVRGDTPVKITAMPTGPGGVAKVTRMTVLTGDRECRPGTADPAKEQIKARSFAAHDDTGTNQDCGYSAEFDNGITVGAGTSGLPVGTPVELDLSLRFDGANFTSPPLGGGGSVANGTSNYTIIDESVPPSEETGDRAHVATFRADFELQQWMLDPNNTSYENTTKKTVVDMWSNVTGDQDSRDTVLARTEDAAVMEVDTGTMTARYHTTVGAHLAVFGRVSTVASAYGTGSSAIADFSNTFQATSKPAPGFEGLALTYDVGEEPTDQAPTCTPGAAATAEDTVLRAGVSCHDLEGGALAHTVLSGPAHGTLSPIAADGSFTYTPADNYAGSDSFTFKAGDGIGESAVVTYTVTVTGVNDAPVCTDGSGTTDAGVALVANVTCHDADGDPLTFTVGSGPGHGSVTNVGSNGSLTYTPDAGFWGTDTFTVEATDGQAFSTATITIVVRRNLVGPPTTKEECKDGSWQRFNNPVFGNQGACVSYVNHNS